jgi:hypothetical protein
MFREKTVYHSGIGHVDLTVGRETYAIATSHRFRGNSILNPTHGQMRYGRFEGLDREVIVAGDSHTPAVQTYADGPMPRVAINCGSLQTDSGYAKRFYSLDTHDWMPVVEFFPDRHLFMPYPSLTHWLAVHPIEHEEETENDSTQTTVAPDATRSHSDAPAGGKRRARAGDPAAAKPRHGGRTNRPV